MLLSSGVLPDRDKPGAAARIAAVLVVSSVQVGMRRSAFCAFVVGNDILIQAMNKHKPQAPLRR